MKTLGHTGHASIFLVALILNAGLPLAWAVGLAVDVARTYGGLQ
jgi:hypothetical protein